MKLLLTTRGSRNRVSKWFEIEGIHPFLTVEKNVTFKQIAEFACCDLGDL